jgi:acyl dehydratase
MTATVSETQVAPITRERVHAFGDAVNDHNPVHFDEEFAKASGLPTTVVHGPLTVAVVLDTIVAQLGADAILNLDVRLRAPVFPGDTFYVRPADYGVSVHKPDGTVVATAVLITKDDE